IANKSTTASIEKMGEAVGYGLSFGLGGAGAAASSTGFARVLFWADRIAIVLGAITSVVREHRGWIIERFGEKGRRFGHAIDVVNSAVALYGIVRVVTALPKVVSELHSSYEGWRADAAARRIEKLMDASEERIIGQIDTETEALFARVDGLKRETAAA